VSRRRSAVAAGPDLNVRLIVLDSNYLLPRSASNKNFATCFVVDFARARKRVRAAALTRQPRGPAARLARALEWQRELDSGEVASRAEIARREGISRARVTQIMNAPSASTEKRPERRREGLR
jgi:CRP-like cAMP-binding protein